MSSRRAPRKDGNSAPPSPSVTVESHLVAIRDEIAALKQQIASTAEQHNSKLDELEKKLEQRDHEISNLKATIYTLQDQLIQQAQVAVSNELEIIGLPEEANENIVHLVKTTASIKLGVKLEDADIDWISRVGPRTPKPQNEPTTELGKDQTAKADPLPRPVVVRLVRRTKRSEILKAAKSRKTIKTDGITADPGHTLFFNERLTKHNRTLFREAKSRSKLYEWKYCWISNGTILLRKQEKQTAHIIRSVVDLDRLLGPPSSVH